jgi:NOL1/NOP2/sun family putative RNA methylase
MERASFMEWLSEYTDAELCMSAFGAQKRFFRVNALKISTEEFARRSSLRRSPSPYYDAAFELDEKEGYQLGRTWEYFLGLIYPQSLPSILVSLVLGPKPGESVLDVAAAPGSKFSHMAMLMRNQGVLVGNDIKGEKISALYSTINRMNVLNCIVTSRDGSRLGWLKRFDKVLLDAPCTALGSGPGAYERWKPENSARISNLQTRMLFSAYDALKPGGEMVYSTCTYAKEENEGAVKSLLDNVPGASLESIALDIPHEPGLAEFGDGFRKCMRIYPHHLQSEGFFIARIRKAD